VAWIAPWHGSPRGMDRPVAWINFLGMDENGDSGHFRPKTSKFIHACDFDPCRPL